MSLKKDKTGQKNREILLVKAVEEKITKQGKPFIKVTVCDKEMEVVANIWDWTKERFLNTVEIGSLIICDIIPQPYKEAISYEIRGFGPAPETEDIADYIRQAPIAPETMFQELISKTDSMESTVLKEITKNLLEKEKEKILIWSAAKSMHHNYLYGWLYHTYRMTLAAEKITEIYEVNKDLLIAGTILHDIGKLEELDSDKIGVADYTTEGNLYGHLLEGTFMIRDMAISLGYGNEEATKLLLHMIASHHGKMEYGAIRTPCIPEALLLHELDMIDSRMDMFEQTYANMEEGTTSDNIFGLDCRVYKPR